MARWFNIAGPCFAEEHYMLPPERRLDAARELLEQGRYFTLVAGRQTGKTTSLRWLRDHYNAAGALRVTWVDLETAREQPDPTAAFRTALGALERALARDLPAVPRPSREAVEDLLRDPGSALLQYLRAVCAASDRPVVLLLDEADALVGAAMVSLLAQLRELYLTRRDAPSPRCVVLVGQRAVRDYALSEDERRDVPWLGTASPFNVTVESVGLAPFTEAEVVELTAQHTADTGQPFAPEAAARIYTLSQGHPWLVNALADQCTRRDVRDRAVAVTAAHVEAARETLILERRTHIDSLAARLREPRVRRVLDPMIAGLPPAADLLDDDVAYVVGLGLCRIADGRCEVANPIYREVIPRALTYARQVSLDQQTAWYLRADGALDVPKLMAAWQNFWRRDGHLAAEGFAYRESGPHLVLMAFLQRIVNGGGRIEREYALGKGALDLLLFWKTQRVAIEVKLRRDTETEGEALAQVAGYLDALGLDVGWLVLFDLRAGSTWSERIFTRARQVGAATVHVVGC
ncbi:MAG: AAA-like domain-containing protein [Deltaproteobacteria bacterium]|nr:AAA-like domain-containing protein [Deltaproteobacteria bacterium]